MGGFDPTKYGAVPVDQGFDPTKYGAVPVNQSQSLGLSSQNAVIDRMLAEHPQHPYYGFTISNILQNALRNAKGMAEGTLALGKDLVQNPNWVTGPNSTLQKFVINPSEQQTVEAGRSLNQGQTVPAIGHALASAIPFLGPYAASVGEQAGAGDIGGAAGNVAGALALAEGAKLSVKGAAKAADVARKARLDVMTGTTPGRIGEISQIPKKMAGVQSIASASEQAVRAAVGAKFPKVDGPIEVSRASVEEPTGLVNEQGQPIMKTVEKVENTTFPELQRKYSELGMQIASEKEAVRNGAPAFQLRDLTRQRQSVNDLMTKAARDQGKLPQLDKARAAWRKFEEDFHNPGSSIRGLLKLRPDQTAEIASHLRRGTNAARVVETLKSYGISPRDVQSLMSVGTKPLAVNVAESGKLRTAGSPGAYAAQRLRESLRQATVNELPTASEARLPAWSMRRLLPGIFGEIPIGPREITAWRLRRALRKLP